LRAVFKVFASGHYASDVRGVAKKSDNWLWSHRAGNLAYLLLREEFSCARSMIYLGDDFGTRSPVEWLETKDF